MIFERRTYLKQLLDGSRNDMVKIVTGIRRCGKSFLLFNLFRTYLLEHGTDERHIICLSLDDRKNRRLLNPDVLLDYIDELNPDDGQTTYVILDEVQLVEDFVGVMLSLMHMRNVQAYVSGSNSRFLSTDVVTEFRGRGWEIRVHPLSFAEVYDILVEYVDVPGAKNGEQVIAMHFDGWVWGKVPYTYHGCPYYKVESITKVMPRDMYDERLKASFPHEYSWEAQAAKGYTLDDINEERVYEAVRLGVKAGRISATAEGQSVDTLLGRFGLKTVKGELTNAAVMLFAKDTQRYPQLMLRLARFVGVDKNVFRDSQRVKGNFFDLLDSGMEFAFKHMSVGGEVVGLQREDKLEIPEEAMREGLINAFCHRNYDSASGSVSMAIYDDRVEIENPGHLPSALTPETMKLPHDSYPANVDIADVLFKTKFLDSWGSGVQRMVDACNGVGLPEPEYKLTPGGVAVVFKRPSAVGDTLNDTQKGVDDTLNDTQKKVDDTQKRDTRWARIVELIAYSGRYPFTNSGDIRSVRW